MTQKATEGEPRRKWHHHPAFIAVIAPIATALLGAATTLYFGKTGQLPQALAPAPPTTTVTVTAPAPTVTLTPTASTPIQDGGGEFVSINELTSKGALVKGNVDINGTTYADGVRADVGGCRRTLSETWNLSRDYNRFVATIGITDTSDSDLRVQFRTYVDSKSATDAPAVTLRKGESRKLDVALKSGLELRLEAVMLAGDPGLCSQPGAAAWGDPTVYR